MIRSLQVIKLASDPEGVGLVCQKDGLTLAGYPLLFDDWNGLAPRPVMEIQDILDSVYGAKSGLVADTLMNGLASAARFLNKGDLPLAMISSLLLKLPEIPEASPLSRTASDKTAKNGYNDAEPRDRQGRWTTGAGGSALQALIARILPNAANAALPLTPAFVQLAPIFVEGAELAVETAEAAAPSLLTRLGAGALGLLDSLAAALGKPTTIGEFYLLPNELPDIQGGTIPDAPGLTYNSVDGFVTISGQDASGKTVLVYQAKPDDHYFYYDDRGLIIGRYTGNAIVFDTRALQEIAEEKGVSAPTPSTAALPEIADAVDTDRPRFCPPPTPENIRGRSDRSLAYQSQITGLFPGWDVVFRGVRYDGCAEAIRHLQEAKGPMGRFLESLSDDQLKKSKDFDDDMDQAERQSDGAAGYTVDWYFADKRFYRVYSEEFAKRKFINIVTHYEEALVKKTEDWIAEIG